MSKKKAIQFACMSLVILLTFAGIIVYKRNLDDHFQMKAELNRSCTCELSKIHRIVNGQIEENLFIPWQASIARSGQHICMGVLVNQYWILSAQHCFPNSNRIRKKFKYEVRVGLFELFDPNLKENTYQVTQIHNYPSFDYYKMLQGGDLALIRVATPIQFKRGLIEPACIDLGDEDLINLDKKYNFDSITNSTENDSIMLERTFLASGFGTNLPVIYQNNIPITEVYPSLVLRTIEFFDVMHLIKDHPLLAFLLDFFIFVEPIKNNQKNNSLNLCKGDSGNALNFRINSSGKAVVLGIACSSIPINYNSTAKEYCRGYSLYTKLSYRKYKNFIDGIVGTDLRCRSGLIENRILSDSSL